MKRKSGEEQETRPWVDLPQDILVTIHNKLHFVDQLQFRAVCKYWRIPKNFIRSLYNIPWALMKFSWITTTTETNRYPFECKFFDPYSKKTYNVSNYIEEYHMNPNNTITRLYASKYGWLLFGLIGDGTLLFLHNPFTNKVIMLPHLDVSCTVATFTMDPTSPDCEFLALCRPHYGKNFRALYFGRCCPSRDKEWSVEFLEFISREPFSVCYMKEELYCAFENGFLRRYNLINKCWNLVLELPESRRSNWHGNVWLIENKSDLLLGRFKNPTRGWSIFKLDWSKMCWVLQKSVTNVAFFISGKINLMAPLEDSKGKITDNCMEEVGIVAHEDLYGRRIKHYVLPSERIKQRTLDGGRIRSLSYMMSFIEPPYVRN